MAGGGWVVVVVWVWWGGVELPNTAEFNMAVLWWKHGVCVVCTKHTCFANKIIVDPMRVSSQGWLQNKHVGTLHSRREFGKNRSVDDDRSGGRVDGMDWFGEG